MTKRSKYTGEDYKAYIHKITQEYVRIFPDKQDMLEEIEQPEKEVEE